MASGSTSVVKEDRAMRKLEHVLFMAAGEGRLEEVKELVEQGVDMNARVLVSTEPTLAVSLLCRMHACMCCV